eukprot:1449507-Rhodomonas_salina.8
MHPCARRRPVHGEQRVGGLEQTPVQPHLKHNEGQGSGIGVRGLGFRGSRLTCSTSASEGATFPNSSRNNPWTSTGSSRPRVKYRKRRCLRTEAAIRQTQPPRCNDEKVHLSFRTR